jgi:hypothetical protein
MKKPHRLVTARSCVGHGRVQYEESKSQKHAEIGAIERLEELVRRRFGLVPVRELHIVSSSSFSCVWKAQAVLIRSYTSFVTLAGAPMVDHPSKPRSDGPFEDLDQLVYARSIPFRMKMNICCPFGFCFAVFTRPEVLPPFPSVLSGERSTIPSSTA